MSGGKGGSSTTEVKIPEYLEKAAQRNLNKAEALSQIGYTPYYGPDVAAFTPMQNAAFQNTAGTASAFGMAAPSGNDIYGGMGPATTYANGVTGYSSAPLYEQSLAQLAQKAPAQKAYIDSFFIDPRTGRAGGNVQAPIDYNQFTTAAEDQRQSGAANRANELAIAQANASAGPSSVTSNYSYDGRDYSSSAPANTYITNPATGITNTGTVNPVTGALYDAQEAIIGNTLGLVMPSYKTGNVNNPIKAPTVQEMIDAAPKGMTYDPKTGSYKRVATPSVSAPKTTSSAPTTSPRPVSREGVKAGTESAGKGCVVATHAVASGAFTPKMKREAVVWCMDVLHGKWWGEAIRRGYRHMGRKKIEQGKAHEHYAEFRRYIAFANGSKRDLKGALTFTLRTAQFFVVGMFDKEA